MPRYLLPTQFRLIEEEVEKLLEKYAERFSPITGLRIPVELIAERLLGLQIEQKKLGRLGRGTLGVLIVEEKRILVDERCNDTQYYFTVSHEIGHYVMHVVAGRPNVFIDALPSLSAWTRSSGINKKAKRESAIESEANDFAAALLIPRQMLRLAVTEAKVLNSHEVHRLAKEFGTSVETMLLRIEHLDDYDQDLGVRLDQNSLDILKNLLQNS